MGFRFQVSSLRIFVSAFFAGQSSFVKNLKRESSLKLETLNLKPEKGFTLFELIVTLTVLTILVMGTVPLAQNAVRRQKELQLRATLRDIRNAIDEFKRDTNGACPQGAVTTTDPTTRRIPGQNNSAQADPRSRVVIDDCTIFDTSNLDRYPPSLDILVEGVKVKARTPDIRGGGVFSDKNATEINQNEEVTKYYLRKMPVDPLTGRDDTWELRSSYQSAEEESWDSINVFDVRSGADGEALNGEKYSDW